MIRLHAPAKVNLYLDILRRRADGFHDLRTAFAALSLGDEIATSAQGPLDPARLFRVALTVEGPFAAGVPTGEENLLCRALVALARALGVEPRTDLPPLPLYLKKNVPHGAGLGGGSSDAAAALRLAAGLLEVPPPAAMLHAVAASIGSDCAFFLGAPFAEGTGRGEVLTPLPARSIPLLVVLPEFPISTREAYGRLRPEHLGARSDAEGLRRWLGGTGPLPALENSFEPALDPLHPRLRTVREQLRESGAVLARLSGSGSACFGLFATAQDRDAAAAQWQGSERLFPCEAGG